MGRTELDDLLAAHQAIIDAWYAEWVVKVKAHASAVGAKIRRAQSADARKKGE